MCPLRRLYDPSWLFIRTWQLLTKAVIRMAKRKSGDKKLHDKAVKAIAKKRFPFPSKKHPTWQTYTNEPRPSISVVSGGKALLPDIAVVDESKGDTEEGLVDKTSVVMLGEVETESSVNEEEVDQWVASSKLTDAFFLYVPEALCDEAKRLSHKLKVCGFREWKFDSEDDIAIADC